MGKFNNTFAAIDEPPEESTVKPPARTRPPKAVAPQEPAPVAPPTRTARPKGKSSNPEFTLAAAYIRKTTKKAVDIRLRDEEGQDFSDLVETLLQNWLTR